MIEKELLEKALRGFYRTGCFHIYLAGSFDQDLNQMSQQDLGIFLHEYVHYLQNISTPYGIFEAVALNEAAVETFIDIAPKEEIELPYDAPQSDKLKMRLDWLKDTNGQPIKTQDNLLQVDENKDFLMGVLNHTIHGRNCPLIALEFHDKQGIVHRRIIGALDIKEAMAAAYQSLIDPNADHPDIPYNLLRMYCKQAFPSVGTDVKKFICLCYLSLFSLDPAYQFVNLCYQAEEKKDQSGFKFFDEYMNNRHVITGDKSMKPWEHYNELLVQYRESIQGLLRCETPYIDTIFVRLRMTDGNVPLLNVLNTNEAFTSENVKALVNVLGIPYLHAQGRGWFFPSLDGVGASDVVKLVGMTWLYQFLITKDSGKMRICPLVSMCGQFGDYCYDQPWLERGCSFEIIGDEIGLKNKTITIKG